MWNASAPQSLHLEPATGDFRMTPNVMHEVFTRLRFFLRRRKVSEFDEELPSTSSNPRLRTLPQACPRALVATMP
jgi:hypothetical protein